MTTPKLNTPREYSPPVNIVRYCPCGRRLGSQAPGYFCSTCVFLEMRNGSAK